MFKRLTKKASIREAMHQSSRAYLYSVGKAVWSNKSYQDFSQNAYIQNVIAHRAVNMITQAAVSVPFRLYQKIDGQKHLIKDHPLLDLLAKPNPTQSGKELLEAIYIFRQIAGNAYLLTVDKSAKDRFHYPEPSTIFGGFLQDNIPEQIFPQEAYEEKSPSYELYSLRPDRIAVIAGENFLPMGYSYTVDGKITNYYLDQDSGFSPILHIKNFHPLSDWYGLSSIEAAAYSLDQHNQASIWNQALLQNGGRPSGAIIVKDSEGKPANLSEDQFIRLKKMMAETVEGPENAGKPLLLEGGLEWKEMSFSPKDMEYLQAKNNSAREIALAFGVPSQLLGIPGDNTYSNLSEARIALWEQTVIPLVENTLDHFNRGIVSRFGSDLELQYDLEGVSALSHRVESVWKRMESSSFVTLDEKREAVGLSPAKKD
jgi:HK97 family phage portal protein